MFQLKFPQGSNIALIDGDVQLSFDQLHQLREIISTLFLDAQQSHPVRVLGCLNDDINAIFALLTITELCDFMPINPQLTETEIQRLVKDSNNVDVVIMSADLMATHAPSLVEHIPVILDWDNIVNQANSILANANTANQADVKSHASTQITTPTPIPIPIPIPIQKPGRLILHTSGSTGKPKRVPITLESINASAAGIAKSHQLSKNDIALNILPTFHIGALVDVLLAPFQVGGTVTISSNRTPKALADTLLEIRPTWVQLVPTILRHLVENVSAETLQDAGASLSFVRCISAPLPPDLKLKAEALLGCPIIEMYGMTETAGQITTNSREGLNKSGSAGQAGDVRIMVLDSFGNAVKNGEVGEVCVCGPTVFSGYEGVPEADVFFDQWFRTGDIGELDSEGYLFLRGRLKEMINVGGEKVSPFEIETAALSHAHVLEAASYSLSHPTLGEQVGLTIACSDKAELVDIAKHLKTHLADFKCPRNILQTDELPRLPNAKIDRVLLKRNGEDALRQRNLQSAKLGDASQSRSTIETTIAQLWSKELKCRIPLEQDDFFDMGGDSLSATSFLTSLETALGHKISASQLFTTPTFESLAKSLSTVDVPTAQDKPAAVAFVEQQMAGWAARPFLSDGLFRGVGTLKSNQAIFWGVQDFEEFNYFSGSLGKSRPIYITRSLFKYPKRCEQDYYDLAKSLADEIQLIQPEGEIVLGGFCGGSTVMQYVAERLEVLGRQIRVFLSFDYWMERPTSFPVLHAISNIKHHTGRRSQFANYELALPLLHPKGSKIIAVNCDHLAFTPENLAPHLSLINRHIDAEQTFCDTQTASSAHLLSLSDRKKTPSAVIKVTSFSRFFEPGKTSRLELVVRNTSNEQWLKTELSGLSVAVKILNIDMHIRLHTAGYADFPCSVGPNEEVKVTLDVHFPVLALPFMVEILLSNQGVKDFHEKQSGRTLYFVMPRLTSLFKKSPVC